jgi:hypothetical protein
MNTSIKKRICVVCQSKFNGYGRSWYCQPCANDVLYLQRKVTIKLHRRIKAGSMPKANALDCSDCGKPAICYDHRDYTKPYKVVPVCTGCNIRRGPAKKYFKNERERIIFSEKKLIKKPSFAELHRSPIKEK